MLLWASSFFYRSLRLETKSCNMNVLNSISPRHTYPHSLLYLLCCCKTNLGMDLQEFKYEKKTLHLPYILHALKVAAPAWMLPMKCKHSPYKLGGGRCRFERLCGEGGIHLMKYWMAGHTATKAPSHSCEAYLITVLQRAIGLCLSFADICVSASVPPSRLEPKRIPPNGSFRAEVWHYSIKWIISQHLWPTTWLSLAMKQGEMRRNDDGTDLHGCGRIER